MFLVGGPALVSQSKPPGNFHCEHFIPFGAVDGEKRGFGATFVGARSSESRQDGKVRGKSVCKKKDVLSLMLHSSVLTLSYGRASMMHGT